MLFRLVRPLKRAESRNRYFVRRIPADVKKRAIGLKLSLPVGSDTQTIKISPRAEAIRVSLRTDDPVQVKLRQAAIDAHLEKVWQALRQAMPIPLTHRQATALAGELYRAWADGEGRERTIAVEQSGEGWRRVPPSQEEELAGWVSAIERLQAIDLTGDDGELERTLGALVDKLLLAKGIRSIDAESRLVLLTAFWEALKQAFEARRRNAAGDYSADAQANRFPTWQAVSDASRSPPVSLTGLVDDWWAEAEAAGRKPSTYESYRNTMAGFVAYLGHDDASRVTKSDVVGFKDHRLKTNSPKTGRPVTPKTIKDSDLAGLKTIFGWAKANLKMADNAAEGVTLKVGRRAVLREKGFTVAEARAILRKSLHHRQGNESEKTYEAKRWVPWLCAFSGGRVGELAQLRKADIRRAGRLWIARITPEAGTVKTNEAREIVLHQQLVDLGFVDFVRAAPPGHLFVNVSPDGDVLGPLKGLTNRLAEFVREVVPDKSVQPNHGWRHRFKTVGMEAGIDHRILDAIQGQRPRTVSEGYGDVTIKTKAAVIARFPRYKVT